MAGVKISALPALPSAQLTDLIAEVQPAVGGTTYKATLQQLLTLFTASSGNVNAGLINQMAWYAAAGNTVSGLATANSATLITSAGGVPSLSQTLPTAVQSNITQLGAQSQALNMNSHLINNVTDPVNAQDAATKNYVDTTALNGTAVYAASAATLGTVTQAGAGVGATLTNAGVQATFALDGVNPPVGSNVLIKDTAVGMTSANEGIYKVTSVGSGATNWVLTRATGYDTATEINNTGLIVIQNGSTLSGQAWYNTTTIVTVDTTAFSFTRFGTSGTVTSVGSGTGLTGGAITSSGTLSFAAIAAHKLWANVTAGSAVPTEVATSTFLQSLTPRLITGNATYTPTTGMQFCIVELAGGGGGGGGAGGAGGQAGQGGGGGGAGYCRKLYTAALLGANAAVVIGTGGAGGAAGNNVGVDGVDSTFTPAGAGAILTASKGSRGNGMASTASTNSTQGGTPGIGTNGDVNISGSNGEGGVVVLGSAGVACQGGGGQCYLSTAQANNLSGATNNGNLYGGGGQGGAGVSAANVAGGNGANGVCIITEYIAV